MMSAGEAPTVTLDSNRGVNTCNDVKDKENFPMIIEESWGMVIANVAGDDIPDLLKVRITKTTTCTGSSTFAIKDPTLLEIGTNGSNWTADKIGNICNFQGDDKFIKKTSTTSIMKKIDVTGDGLDDYVLIPQVTHYKCDGTTQSGMRIPILAETGMKPGALPSAMNMKKEKFMVGNVVEHNGKEYMLVAIPNSGVPAPFDGNVLNRDKIIVILISTDMLKKLGTAKDLNDPGLPKEVAGSIIGARLGDLTFKDDIATLPEEQANVLNSGLHVFDDKQATLIELYMKAIGKLIGSEQPKDEVKK